MTHITSGFIIKLLSLLYEGVARLESSLMAIKDALLQCEGSATKGGGDGGTGEDNCRRSIATAMR